MSLSSESLQLPVLLRIAVQRRTKKGDKQNMTWLSYIIHNVNFELTTEGCMSVSFSQWSSAASATCYSNCLWLCARPRRDVGKEQISIAPSIWHVHVAQ